MVAVKRTEACSKWSFPPSLLGFDLLILSVFGNSYLIIHNISQDNKLLYICQAREYDKYLYLEPRTVLKPNKWKNESKILL